MRAVTLFLAALMMALTCGTASAQAPSKRIALVVGNGAYVVPTWKLDNPPKDATRIAAELKKLGFDVDLRVNATRADMEAAFDRFGSRLKATGPEAVGFFFYAGHAAQADGVNYLVPIDANAATADRLRYQSPPLQFLFQDMATAGNAVNIVVLDACRNMPLPDGPRAISGRGLADEGRRANALVAYATAPGSTAADGALSNSPFTIEFASALATQSRDPVALLFDDVGARVYSATNGAQAPEYRNGLVRAPRWSLSPDAKPIPTSTPTVVAALTPPRAISEPTPFLETLDRDKLLAFANNAAFVDSLLTRRDLLTKYEINTPLRLAHFLAQVSYETAGFRYRTENMNYSAQRLTQVFGANRFPPDVVADYGGQPEKIANRAYANRMGNGDEASGDGWRFRGRGLVSLTGRANYQRVAQLIGVDIVSTPDLVTDPETALAVAAATWQGIGANAKADADDLAGVTRVMSGPGARLEQRAELLIKAKAAVAPAP